MTATIKNIFLCPRCDSDIVSIQTVTACPKCGLPLGRQPVAPYSPPYTLTEQHEKYNDKKAYVDAVIHLPLEKVNSMMNDALAIIELIPGKMSSVSDIRITMDLARKIGDIANAYHVYLEAGGKHVPGFYIDQHHQNQENQNVNSEENGARAVPTASTTVAT